MKNLIKKLDITKIELSFIFAMALLMMVITTAPYFYAAKSATPDKIYNGLHILAPGDTYVYFSYLEQVKNGHYLFNNLFTSEHTLPVLNIFWLGSGLIGKWLNLSPLITFHLVRILLIAPCLISLYFLIAYFFTNKLIRKIILGFLLFSSGFGAVSTILLPKYVEQLLLLWPMDLWVPEFNLFLTLYHSPHLILSLTLIILIFLFWLLAIETNQIKYSLIAGLSGLILIQFHPFHLPTIWLIPTLYLIIKFWQAKKISWSYLKHWLILIICSSPSVLYYLWLMLFDWSTKVKASQNYCYTPAFFTVILSYGGLLVGGLLGIITQLKSLFAKPQKHFFNFKLGPTARRLVGAKHPIGCLAPLSMFKLKLPYDKLKDIKLLQWFAKKIIAIKSPNPENQDKVIFLIIWAVSQFILIFLPFKFQRRLTEGLQIPLVFLTIIGFFYLRGILKNKYRQLELDKIISNPILLTIIFVLGFTVSNVFVVQQDLNYFKQNYELFYFTKPQAASYEWLKEKTPKNSIILSAIINGNFIPGASGRKVYIGHVNVETLYFDQKSANLKYFFNNNSDDEAKINFLKQNSIDYIYYSHYEKELGNFNPTEKPYLQQVYSNQFTTIYKVK